MSDDLSAVPPTDPKPESKAAKPRKREARRQWTITSARITPEFRTAVRKAAERAGLSQADWMVDRLQRAAIEELRALDGKLEGRFDGRGRADGRIAAMMDYLVEVRSEVQQARQELAAAARRRGVLARLFGRD
jgi:hypothetical protein